MNNLAGFPKEPLLTDPPPYDRVSVTDSEMQEMWVAAAAVAFDRR